MLTAHRAYCCGDDIVSGHDAALTVCGLCGNAYVSPAHLKLHYRAEHSSGSGNSPEPGASTNANANANANTNANGVGNGIGIRNGLSMPGARGMVASAREHSSRFHVPAGVFEEKDGSDEDFFGDGGSEVS